ncbi:MAG: hypothetical protein HY304_02205, partial [candidate division Zixibacteria bacterium]|nr:hypothetical protein [candidate division Zixibacteria bacterium]
DAIVIEITVANVGPLPIQGLWLGWMIDPDICHFPEFCDHNGCYCSADDIAGFHIGKTTPDADGHPDTVRAAWVADNDGNPDSTDAFNDESPTGAFASMYLGGTPRLNEESFNWWIERFSQLKDSSWGPQHFPGDANSKGGRGRPLGDHMKYRLMSNREIDYDQVYAAFDFSHVGWIKPPPDDIASVYAAGWPRHVPFRAEFRGNGFASGADATFVAT